LGLNSRSSWDSQPTQLTPTSWPVQKKPEDESMEK
jgi:hypothetical protein